LLIVRERGRFGVKPQRLGSHKERKAKSACPLPAGKKGKRKNSRLAGGKEKPPGTP